MTSLTYNPTTKHTLEALRTALPQAVLLTGAPGVGLCATAKDLAWRDLAGLIQSTDKDGNPDLSARGVIRIAQIRDLQQFTRGKSRSARVIIIDDADRMNRQAQNAFLKLLEEPPEHTHFILTSHHPDLLLPTILSRVQRIHVRPISEIASKKLLSTKGISDIRVQQQMLFLAKGRPAELSRLADDPTYFSRQSTMITDARTLLSGTALDKIAIIARIASDRPQALTLIAAALEIVRFSMRNQPSRELLDTSKHLVDLYDAVQANANIRLQFTNFVIQ
jgi:DNA polymerase-3 subunit delta'